VKKYSGMCDPGQRSLAVFCERDDERSNSIKCGGKVLSI